MSKHKSKTFFWEMPFILFPSLPESYIAWESQAGCPMYCYSKYCYSKHAADQWWFNLENLKRILDSTVTLKFNKKFPQLLNGFHYQ